jgi:Na+/proline symporter
LYHQQANSDPNQSLIEAEQNLPPQPMTRVIIIGNQIMLWFGLTHVFTSGFAVKSMSWVILLIGLVIVFMVYGFLVFLSLPTIAGAVYNGSNINKQYVKEVMKRHSQVDKHVLMEQYRSENNGGMPVINDVFIGEYEP